jgi:hypothetical protein
VLDWADYPITHFRVVDVEAAYTLNAVFSDAVSFTGSSSHFQQKEHRGDVRPLPSALMASTCAVALYRMPSDSAQTQRIEGIRQPSRCRQRDGEGAEVTS